MAKAAAKTDEKPQEGEDAPKKKKGKLPLIIGLAVVLLAAGGGGAWFFLGKKGGETAAEAKPQAPKPPIFVPLEQFTVNLTADQQYLQLGATLKLLDQHAADSVKQYMPEIRHRVLGLLAAKKAAEISVEEGRERLSEELRQVINNIALTAVGKPTRPVVLDVPAGKEAKAGDAEETKAEGADEKAEGEDARAEGNDANAEGEATAPPKPPAKPAKPAARTLARAAADDPVQSVFFTSFIIQ